MSPKQATIEKITTNLCASGKMKTEAQAYAAARAIVKRRARKGDETISLKLQLQQNGD